MPKKVEFPILFEKCPSCGCKDTVTRLAYKQEVVDKDKGPDTFASFEKRPVPLIAPTLMATLLVKHFDTCAGCGLYYCTKAEIVIAPVTAKKMPDMKQFGFQQGHLG